MVSQPHVSAAAVGTCDDELGGGFSVHGVVHLVLHARVKAPRGERRPVVVDRSRVEVRNFLIELAFAGADFAHAFELLLEIFVRERAAAFEAGVVHHPAFDRIGRRDLIDPLSELDGALGIDLEPDRQNHLKRVVLGAIRLPVGGSYSKISNN